MLAEGVNPSGNNVGLKVDADGKLLVGGVTLEGDVTIGSEVEISNDDGNPVPISGTVTVGNLEAAPIPVNVVDGTISITAGDNNIGNVDIASALPAGTHNIGKVDIEAALPAGTNKIGSVDIASEIPAGTKKIGSIDIASALPAGTNNIGDVDVLSLPSLPAGTNNIGDVDVASLPALAAGTNSIGAVASNSVLSSATVTRPSDTTPYTAKDAIGPTVAAVIEFTGMARANGGSGTVVKARLMTNQSTNTAQFRLHLFHTTPTAINDNSPYTLLDLNKANRVGMIDFPACATEGSGSDAAASMRPSSDGSYPPPNLWYKCAANDTKLYGLLETLSAFTPASGQTFFIELGADGLS